MSKEENNEELSLSKQRKLARKKKIAKEKRNSVIAKVVLVLVILAAVGLIAFFVIKDQIKKAKSITASTDYSTVVDDNGMIKGIKASDYVSIPDYNNIPVSLSDVEYTDDKVEADIQTTLNNNKTLETSAELTAADGDKVNIDFAGTVDGVEFEGGTSTGHDLTLGSGSLIDDFEQQIEGHHPGDSFDVEVTFPEEYDNNPDLAGKDAVFAVTLNGIYVAPEFTDEFVQEKLSEHATTAEEYRKYLKDTNYEKNLSSFVYNYVVENTTINKTPSDFLKQLKAAYKAEEYSYYEYMNSMYSTYYGYTPYTSFDDYLTQIYSMNEEQYDESLEEKVMNNLKYTLFCQAVAEAEGITANVDDAKQYYLDQGVTEENLSSQIQSYGKGYVTQNYLDSKVLESICDRTVVK